MGPPPRSFRSPVIRDNETDTTVVFTSVNVRDNRELKASQAKYDQARKSKFADPSKLSEFFDIKPRGLFTNQPAQISSRQPVTSINPEWNPAQGNWDQPQPVVELEEEDEERPATSAEKAHRRRASLDPRTFRSQPFAYVIKPRDRFAVGKDAALWRVEQERQRLERMDPSMRPVEYVFNGQVFSEDAPGARSSES